MLWSEKTRMTMIECIYGYIFFIYLFIYLSVSWTFLHFRSAGATKKLKKAESSKALLASVTKQLPGLTRDVIKKWNSLSTKVNSADWHPECYNLPIQDTLSLDLQKFCKNIIN